MNFNKWKCWDYLFSSCDVQLGAEVQSIPPRPLEGKGTEALHVVFGPCYWIKQDRLDVNLNRSSSGNITIKRKQTKHNLTIVTGFLFLVHWGPTIPSRSWCNESRGQRWEGSPGVLAGKPRENNTRHRALNFKQAPSLQWRANTGNVFFPVNL